jgi:hypothetical protein
MLGEARPRGISRCNLGLCVLEAIALVTNAPGAEIMYWTTKLLVIANRTIDANEIRDAIVSRAAGGPLEVTLVAPVLSGTGSMRTRRTVTAKRLDGAVKRLNEAGVKAEAIVGDADPMVAVQDAWDPRRFDEVIVVTPPTGVPRWMPADLPHRVERLTAARVTHIVAAGS